MMVCVEEKQVGYYFDSFKYKLSFFAVVYKRAVEALLACFSVMFP